jgi:YfdX protein
VVARDPKMARASVTVTTSILDLYATPETVKAVSKEAMDDLSNGRVQHARLLVQDLCSEADIHLAEIPLATYPAAIKAVAQLIDAGRTEEAKAALYAALNTLVIETFVVPLPKIRASAMLIAAGELADKKDRKADDTTRMHGLMDAARQQLQLAEALGYGTKDSYKPLYTQLDEIQKKGEPGQSGRRLFDRLRNSLKNFKFST